jgi:hypothetical protein
MGWEGPARATTGASYCRFCDRWLHPSSQRPGWTPRQFGPAWMWSCPDCSRTWQRGGCRYAAACPDSTESPRCSRLAHRPGQLPRIASRIGPGAFGESGEPCLGVRLTLCCAVGNRSCGYRSSAGHDSPCSGSSGSHGGHESRALRRSGHACRTTLIATLQQRPLVAPRASAGTVSATAPALALRRARRSLSPVSRLLARRP